MISLKQVLPAAKQKEYEHFLFVLLFTRLALQRYSVLHLICVLSGVKPFSDMPRIARRDIFAPQK